MKLFSILKLPVEYTNSIGMKFVLIPPGEFTMGSTAAEIEQALKQLPPDDKSAREATASEGPAHKVVLTRPFYLAVHEVTQMEYEAVMGKNPAAFAKTGSDAKIVDQLGGIDTANRPVEMVSWNDAAEFCAKLSGQEDYEPFYFRAGDTVTPLRGTGYRLPTEAEWEYACRAGTTTRFWCGDNDQELLAAGWSGGNSGLRTHEVEELSSNPFGLFDVHGNAWEWVEDSWEPTYYEKFADKPAINPARPFFAGALRVARGGAWDCRPVGCRSAYRYVNAPADRGNVIGFRVVCER